MCQVVPICRSSWRAPAKIVSASAQRLRPTPAAECMSWSRCPRADTCRAFLPCCTSDSDEWTLSIRWLWTGRTEDVKPLPTSRRTSDSSFGRTRRRRRKPFRGPRNLFSPRCPRRWISNIGCRKASMISGASTCCPTRSRSWGRRWHAPTSTGTASPTCLWAAEAVRPAGCSCNGRAVRSNGFRSPPSKSMPSAKTRMRSF